MKKYRAFLLIICLLVASFAHAEYFNHLGQAEGLSHSSVMAIHQDQLGRMWFGTREGISIYNKGKMTVYKGWIQNGAHPEERLLIGNEVDAIAGDSRGDVFLIIDAALLKYDVRKESFKVLRSEGVSALTSDKGDIWCSIHDSIFCYNPQSAQLEFREKTYLTSINHLLVNGQNLYIGARSGLYTATVKTPVRCLLANVDVYRTFKSSQQELWVACRTQGLYRIDGAERVTKVPYDPSSPHAVASDQIREFVEDRHGNIWFGTFNGLQKYNSRTCTYSLISSEQRRGGLNHSSIFSLYQDVQGTLWIGSYYGGVNYFNPDNNVFNYYPCNPDRNDCLNYPFAGAMTEDNDSNLWVCTDGGGLACMDRLTGKFTTYKAGGSNSVPHDNLKSICYDARRDQLYIGTHLGGLSRYDRRTGRFHNYLYKTSSSIQAPNNVIFQTLFHNDRLFVSARNGFFILNPDTDEFKLLLKDMYYQTFSIDSCGDLWLAGIKNVYRINPVSYQKTDSLNLSANGCRFPIAKILKTNNDKLYIATLGSGLYSYDLHTRKLTNYTSGENRLLSDYCYNLLQTDEGNLLITSDRGITLFNQVEETFRSIGLDSGLSLSSIIDGCGVWNCRDNTLFVGGTGGLVSFLERDLNIGYNAPRFYFSDLSVNNVCVSPDDATGVLTEAMPFVREVKLKSDQNNLTFEFAVSNYVDLLNSSWYEYKLEGFDHEWITTSQTSLKYTNLDPGAYVLHVRQKGNLLNVGQGQEISLKIRIFPPWYLTWWACLTFLALSISITFFVLCEISSRRTLARYCMLFRIQNINSSYALFYIRPGLC